MKTGAQLYTIREFTKTEKDIEASLKKLKTTGYDLVQLSALGPCDTDRLAGWLGELEIRVCGTHSPWKSLADPQELKKTVAEHRKLGCSHIGLGMKPDIFPDTYEGYSDFIKEVNKICKQLKDEGMVFGYHNHELEFQKFNRVKAIDRLAEECPDLDFILDVFWVQAGGASPSEYIEKLKGRIHIIHFKDFRVSGRTRQYAEIGEGNLDWDDIVPRCRKNGIPYAVIEQDGDFLTGPFESLALSKKFLTEKGYW
ncbi:MAG: sugar phosphate isomerase/epimerase [Treponema sp.]|nr:sugar phosphate isomerase/epimerase [Treponema sp.]